jgi:hypothetical protein
VTAITAPARRKCDSGGGSFSHHIKLKNTGDTLDAPRPESDRRVGRLRHLWTAAMIWWNAPGVAGAIIFMIAGAFCGVGWYAGMRLWTKCCARRASG